MKFRPLFQATRGYASQAAVKVPMNLYGLAGECLYYFSIRCYDIESLVFSGFTGKYATSTFLAAANKDAKTLEKVEGDLKNLKQLLHPSASTAEAKKLQLFIANPTLSVKEKTSTLNQLLGGKESEITK
jgi:F-type H+-transporting ATPase subunit O